ncbi:MAG: nicotinamide riboside transporter PnuC [Fimbriimonadaceae bacterium]|jgi:nicotinamide mononucleotide transporter|nr:nicotinamide riboside transporter PnuC [Fimbriimonadaceae bacterium]
MTGSALQWLEWAAIAVTLVYVLLQLKASIWSFVPGIFSAILYGVYFWNLKLPANAILQFAYYLPMMVLGFWVWFSAKNAEGKSDEKLIVSLSLTGWIGLILGLAGGTFGTMQILPLIQPGSELLFLDSFTTTLSIAAQILVTAKIVENWVAWVVVNLAYVVMMLQLGSPWSAGLFGLFFILSVVGYVNWYRAGRELRTHA